MRRGRSAAPDLLFKAEDTGIGIVTGAGMHARPSYLRFSQGRFGDTQPRVGPAYPDGRELRRDLMSMSRYGAGIAVSMPEAERPSENTFQGVLALYE